MPEDDMGDGHALKDTHGKSITEETFKILADQIHKPAQETKQSALNQLEGTSKTKILSEKVLQNAAESQGMTLEETTRETIKLLKKELQS